MRQVSDVITYFAGEGKANLRECLRLSFETLSRFHLEKLIVFTGIGDGIQEALDHYLILPEYSHVNVVGVTFPQGFEVKENSKISPHAFPNERRDEFRARGIRILRAHLPFDSISTQYQHQHGVLAQDMSIVGNALNVICGGMSLCIQATLIACDAGEVEIGEHIVVMTSDTALIVRAAPTSRLLTDLIVRQIICKPAFLTISKSELSLDAGEESEQRIEAGGCDELEQEISLQENTLSDSDEAI